MFEAPPSITTPPPDANRPGARPGPRSGRPLRAILQVHRWTGLAIALLLLVVGGTGSLLVFAEEIDHLLFPHLHFVAPGPARPELDALYRALWRDHPEARSVRIRRFPSAPDRTVEATVELPGPAPRFRSVHVDPHTRRVTGSRAWPPSLTEHPTGWLLRLHYTLLLGKAGEWLVGLLSILLFVSITTGFVVYRRFVWRVLTLRVRPRLRDVRTAVSDLHRVVGVWAWLFNLVIAVTGFWFLRHVWRPDFYGKAPPPPQEAPLAVSLDALLATARAKVPTFVPLGFWTSTGTSGELRVEMFGDDLERSFLHAEHASRLRFDGRTGALVEVALVSRGGVGAKLDAMAAPLHFGTFGGLPVKLVYVVGGLTPPLLSITGFALWWRRRRPRRSGDRDRRGARAQDLGGLP